MHTFVSTQLREGFHQSIQDPNPAFHQIFLPSLAATLVHVDSCCSSEILMYFMLLLQDIIQSCG